MQNDYRLADSTRFRSAQGQLWLFYYLVAPRPLGRGKAVCGNMVVDCNRLCGTDRIWCSRHSLPISVYVCYDYLPMSMSFLTGRRQKLTILRLEYNSVKMVRSKELKHPPPGKKTIGIYTEHVHYVVLAKRIIFFILFTLCYRLVVNCHFETGM